MDKDKQPGIKFENVVLIEEKFWRDYDVKSTCETDISFELSKNTQNNKHFTKIKTEFVCIDNEKEVLNLSCVFVGIFSEEEGNENLNIEEYINEFSAALMFPYIREHLYTVTSKAGIKPLRLPPMNILALLKKNEEKKEKVEEL
jgi:preprotein translocase subunit SecB